MFDNREFELLYIEGFYQIQLVVWVIVLRAGNVVNVPAPRCGITGGGHRFAGGYVAYCTGRITSCESSSLRCYFLLIRCPRRPRAEGTRCIQPPSHMPSSEESVFKTLLLLRGICDVGMPRPSSVTILTILS